MIQSWMLDELNDLEILILDRLLKHKRYREIAIELDLYLTDVQWHANQIYKKLHIYPCRPLILRMIWRNSIEFQKAEKQYKSNYLKVENLPVGKGEG